MAPKRTSINSIGDDENTDDDDNDLLINLEHHGAMRLDQHLYQQAIRERVYGTIPLQQKGSIGSGMFQRTDNLIV